MSDNDTQASGRVYLFKYPSIQAERIFMGQSGFEQLGYDLDLSVQLDSKTQVIAISSITKGKLT
jgi:hypothetical protein